MTKRLLITLFCASKLFSSSFPLSDGPPFSADVITHYYFGQNLDLLNDTQPFDAYSLFQYIFDFGISLDKKLIPTSADSLSLNAQVRMKGIFGHSGSCLSSGDTPIKVGWGRTEAIHLQEIEKFLIWMREVDITYRPTMRQKTYFRIGLFPFKIGHGLVLGNAYRVKIPIPGQYVYEQIDQFRPGLIFNVSNEHETMIGTAYLGIEKAKSTRFLQNAAVTNGQNLETPYDEQGANKGTVLAVAQAQISHTYKGAHTLTFCPYLLGQNSSQAIEFPNDATSNLGTFGFSGTYSYNSLEVGFECAKNFGKQHVKAWDRNQLVQANGIFNTHLFYTADTTLTLAKVTDADFTFATIPVYPTSIALSYGNGTNFIYSPSLGTNFIFKNSYDRFRRGYDNTYTGFLFYADCLITMKAPLTLGLAFAYASGADNPNDSDDTILMTRLTPGITYKDYNKKYHGFVGIEQLFEGKSINPLYFAQAQKMNQPFTDQSVLTTPQFTNQGFFGTTLRYKGLEHKAHTFCAQGTVVSYFMATSIKKGLSASLWQAQSLNFTTQMYTDMNSPLPQFLGNEFNFSLDYHIGSDFTFSLLGAFFFPGKFYKQAAGKTISLALQTQLNSQNFGTNDTTPPTFGSDTCFFLSAALTCLFDLADCKRIFTKDRS